MQSSATPGSLASNNLVSGILNEGTFIAATGADIGRAPSRLTVDASSFSSNSITRNTQFGAYDNFAYRLRSQLALLARVRYQNMPNGSSTSALRPCGAIVDQNSDLPIAFCNPGLGMANAAYRQRVLNVGLRLSDEIGTNRYSVYGHYINQAPIGLPAASPIRSFASDGGWPRWMRSDLNGVVSLGCFNTRSAISANALALVGNLDTATDNLGLNHQFAPTLTGSILDTFFHQTNGGAGVLGNVVVNALWFRLTKTF